MVLSRHAQDVRQRPDAGKDADARTRQRLVIELADAMAATPSTISDDLYACLRGKFSEEQLLELGAHLAFENYRARLNRVFNLESDQLYTPG